MAQTEQLLKCHRCRRPFTISSWVAAVRLADDVRLVHARRRPGNRMTRCVSWQEDRIVDRGRFQDVFRRLTD